MSKLNAVAWFDIPASDLERAMKFYGHVLDKSFTSFPTGNDMMALFPHTGTTGGALMQGKDYVPSTTGSLVYIECGDDLQPMLDRVEAAGGTALTAKLDIGDDNGYVAYILDSEGNKVGLYSSN